MPDAKLPEHAIGSLKELAHYLAEKAESSDWGKVEFAKLVREARANREKIEPAEARIRRRVVAALDRITSIHVAANGALQIVDDDATPIAARVVLDVLAILLDQAHPAVSDAFGAVRAVERSPTRYDRRIRGLPFSKAASALAACQPEPSDLVALLSSRRNPVERALRVAMMACWFVERAMEVAEELVRTRARCGIPPETATNLFRFLMNAAAIARDVITPRVAGALERRGPKVHETAHA